MNAQKNGWMSIRHSWGNGFFLGFRHVNVYTWDELSGAIYSFGFGWIEFVYRKKA